MSIYLIALTEPDEDVGRKVREKWPGNHYEIVTESMFMVSAESMRPQTILELIGITEGEDRPTGIVLEIPNNMAGVLPQSAVDWYVESRRG